MKGYRRITRRNRYQIEELLASGKSIKFISDKLGFHRSSIYREVKKGTITVGVTGGKKKGEYSSIKAHREFLSTFSHSRRTMNYRGKIIRGWVQDQVILKLHEGWSPKQISVRLKEEKSVKISHESIYKFILSMKNRGHDFHKCLRQYRGRKRRFKRRKPYWETQRQRRRSIDDRPLEANERSQAGHWERDLMLGKRGSGGILVLVDRKTRFTILKKLRNTTSEETSRQTAAALEKTKIKCRTLTNDNGHEFGFFWKLEEALESKIYFTHPLSPWERGTVENTIGLVRQFIPKGTDLRKISDNDLREIENLLNSRPRSVLGFKTPNEVIENKRHKLILQKRIASPSAEYYEQFYLTAREQEELRIFRGKSVAMAG